jgi:hypothetical protein
MKKRVLIACPAKGGVSGHWFEQHDALQKLNHPDYAFEFVIETGHGGINFARNIIADEAIRRDVWKVVQIDADMRWLAADVVRLVSVPEPIVYAPYVAKKSGPVHWLVIATPGAKVDDRGLLQCDFVGTGAVSIEVAALRAMVAFYPERRFVYENDDSGIKKTMTELFPMGLVGPNTPEGRLARIEKILEREDETVCVLEDEIRNFLYNKIEDIESVVREVHPGECRLLGEDHHFSRLARKAGFKLWTDMNAVIGHVGDAIYPIGPEQLSSAACIPSSESFFEHTD